MLIQEGAAAAFHPQLTGAASIAVRLLWLIPVVPIVAAGIVAGRKQPRRKLAAGSQAIEQLVARRVAAAEDKTRDRGHRSAAGFRGRSVARIRR